MSTDELVDLCQALVGDLTLAQARKGLGVAKNLDDDQFILLMRFMAGERPHPDPLPAATPISHSNQPSFQFDDDEDDGPTVVRGEFDGVTLI